MKLIPTASQTAGPFLHLGLTDKGSVAEIAGPAIAGERVEITCHVLDGDELPVSDAMIEVWQADAQGRYRHPEDLDGSALDSNWRGFGRLALDDHGNCKFWTVKPGRVPGPENRQQAPHLNVAIFARGLLKQLVTRIYFAGEPANAKDPILDLVPERRRATLFAHPDPAHADRWIFDVRLAGENETVFFDV